MAERNISKIEEVMRFPPAAITRHLLKKEAAKHNIVTKIKCHRTDCSVFSLNFTIYFFFNHFWRISKIITKSSLGHEILLCKRISNSSERLAFVMTKENWLSK